jgi:membrane protein DedA with SNARE-associated domain
MPHDLAALTQLIITYRYWILVPLSMLEGPIVAFTAGGLASLGYFNVFALAIFFFARDMIMDATYYAIGHFGGKSDWVRRMMKRVGVDEDHLEEVRSVWEKHPAWTMFSGKLAYGVATGFVVLAGTINMPLRKFFGWGAVVTVVQFWGLLALGYFFGNSFSRTSQHLLQDILTGIGVLVLLASIYYLGSLYLQKRWRKDADPL